LIIDIYRNFTFDAVHVDGARRLAEASAENGVARFVQVSALNASEDSTSKFLRSKVIFLFFFFFFFFFNTKL
jgi:NADH dehydrogenase (ubiquinone) 1 alpha subcomplex subunit 9